MTERGRLRVSVEGPAPLVIESLPEDVAAYAPAGHGELVRELAGGRDNDGQRRLEVVVEGWRFEVTVEQAARAALRERATRVAEGNQAHALLTLRAQIPGRVVRLWVSEGEQVEQGQRLLAVEAMKMENEIRAPHAGTVEGLRVSLEQKVERGDELLSIG